MDLSDILESMHAGVCTTDSSGRLLFVNAAARRLLGYREDDLTGRPAHDLLHPELSSSGPGAEESCALSGALMSGTAARSADDVFWREDHTPLPVSWIAAPLVANGAITGAVMVFSDATDQHGETQRLLTREHSLTGAQRRLTAVNDRLVELARMSDALSTLDLDGGLSRVAHLAVGRLVDWCVVEALEPNGAVRRVALAHQDFAAHTEDKHLHPMPPLTGTANGTLARALLTGVQQTVASTDNSSLGLESDPLDAEQSRLFAELGLAHALVTPLTARHQVLGAMTWVRLDPTMPFSAADRLLAAEVGRRAGLALDNARLYQQQRAVAETLQRSLLTVLPEPDWLQLAARYVPATQGAEIGGDWYDAFTSHTGMTHLVIGDVSGHDMKAASLMGQVRNLLRGLCWDRDELPSQIMTRLDVALEGLRAGVMATCLLARVEQCPDDAAAARWLLRWTSAGHPPPALVSASGAVRLLDEPTDLLLGVDSATERVDHQTVIAPGDTIWLYTDGLVERSDQAIDQGLARLRRALAGVADLPLEQGCDELLRRMLGPGLPDDVALLAVRAFPQDRPRPREAGPEHP